MNIPFTNSAGNHELQNNDIDNFSRMEFSFCSQNTLIKS